MGTRPKVPFASIVMVISSAASNTSLYLIQIKPFVAVPEQSVLVTTSSPLIKILVVPFPTFDCKNTETDATLVAVKVMLSPLVSQSQPLILPPLNDQ